jgi:hypothetical protein
VPISSRRSTGSSARSPAPPRGGARHPLTGAVAPGQKTETIVPAEHDQRRGYPALHARSQEQVEVLGAHPQVHVAELLALGDHRQRDVVDLPSLFIGWPSSAWKISSFAAG